MERRVRPWINKKIIEYIGEEEPTLVDFVCSKVLIDSLMLIHLRSFRPHGKWSDENKMCDGFLFSSCSQVMAHSMPQSILDDVAMVSNPSHAFISCSSWLFKIYFGVSVPVFIFYTDLSVMMSYWVKCLSPLFFSSFCLFFFCSCSGSWWRSWSFHCEDVEVTHLWNGG